MYLINWLPSAPLKFDIPYTVLFQTEPDYQFLGVFGCSCFPFLHPYQSHKLEFRSSECVFLGYSPSHKGNKYMSSSGRIFMSKDVIFNEHQFPYRKLFSTSSNSVPIASFSTTLPVLESLILLPLQFHLSLKARSPHPLLSLPVLTLLSHSHLNLLNLIVRIQQLPQLLFILVHCSLMLILSCLQLNLNSPPTSLVRPENVHPVVTRAKAGIVQPRIHPSLLCVHTEPKSVKQALQDSKWFSAMTDEFQALKRNNTWTLVPLPPHRNAIGCKWVYRFKENSDGSINRYKDRLVAKGLTKSLGLIFTF